MPKVKPLNMIVDKWVRQSGNAGESYREGVNNPRKDWATETSNANENYKKGIQQSIAEDRFKKGVNKAGTAKWQRNASAKGPDRWRSGIASAADDYEKGFKPYRDVLERTELPPRGPKGDPKNIDRVRVVAEAMHKEKQNSLK